MTASGRLLTIRKQRICPLRVAVLNHLWTFSIVLTDFYDNNYFCSILTLFTGEHWALIDMPRATAVA